MAVGPEPSAGRPALAGRTAAFVRDVVIPAEALRRPAAGRGR